MIATPQQIIWSVREVMGHDFVQRMLDDFFESRNDGVWNSFLLVTATGNITNWRTGQDCSDYELHEFIQWAKGQDL